LTSQGKIPHEQELQKHPEKSIEGKMWLMGDVSAMIHVSGYLPPCCRLVPNGQDVKPAKEIIDEMVKGAKECLQRGSGYVAGDVRAKL
jgi:hypothetical protein